jgi:monovalent cation:proton antiporter-2 (CPA2) family protein
MQKVLLWQRKKRRSTLAAAAFALSVLVCSSNQLSQYVGVGYGGTQSQSTEINLVQPRNSVPRLARGGETVAPRKSIFKTNAQVNMVEDATRKTGKTMKEALSSLGDYMKGAKTDALILLLATALVTPLSLRLGISPILGFLSSGMLLGPNRFGLISGIHSTEVLAELGIVFFLFEMGIELSVERLKKMRKDVFGLGFGQYILTALAIAGVGSLFGLPANALVVLGGGLALSSSAFVLQLIKDKKDLATRYGKASFGVLLFQDLAVVPLLVVTPILAGSGTGLAAAVSSAVIKANMALGSIALVGHFLLNPLFKIVAEAKSQEAFLGVILLTVLSMSFMTEGLGLSNTLGAFLAGVLLSETKYRYQIEADIAPFRGILLGFFFVTVGFEIDVRLIASNLPVVASIVLGIIGIKAIVLTAVCLAFGLSLSTSQHTGLILSQGGEFAFLAFGLARSLGILDKPTTKMLLTCVSLTMALTPLLDQIGTKIAKRLEEGSDFTHYLGQDRDAAEIKKSDDFVIVAGYGAVGKVVCDMLDRKLIRYECLDLEPKKAIQARNKGLPIFFGNIGRPEVAEAFGVKKAKAVILCISDQAQCTRAAIVL